MLHIILYVQPFNIIIIISFSLLKYTVNFMFLSLPVLGRTDRGRDRLRKRRMEFLAGTVLLNYGREKL